MRRLHSPLFLNRTLTIVIEPAAISVAPPTSTENDTSCPYGPARRSRVDSLVGGAIRIEYLPEEESTIVTVMRSERKLPAWRLLVLAVAAMAGVSTYARDEAIGRARGLPAAPTRAGLTVAAQTESLTLAECIDLALRDNLALRGAVQGAEQAEALARAAKALSQVSVDFGSSAMLVGPRILFEMPTPQGSAALVVVPDHALKAGVTVTKPLYTSGLLEAQEQVSRLQADVSRLQIASGQRGLVLDVKRSFYLVAQAKDYVEVAAQTVQQAVRHSEVARGRFETGVAPRYEVLRSEVAVADARQSVVSAEKAVRLAKIALALALARSPAQPLDITRDSAEPQPFVYDETECTRVALQERCEVAMAQKALDTARAQLRLADAGDGVKVQALAAISLQNSTAFSEDHSWSIGVGLTKPLWDGGRTRFEVQAAQKAVRQAELNAQQVELGVTAEVSAALCRLNEATEQLSTSGATVSEAAEAVRVSQARYTNGFGTSTELTDAETALTAARTNHVAAVSRYWIALAELEAAVNISWQELGERALGREH